MANPTSNSGRTTRIPGEDTAMTGKKGSDEGKGDEGEGKGGGKKKLIMMVVPALLVIGAAVYFFVLAPSGSSAEDPSAEASASVSHAPGAVVAAEPITINLDNGHYLKLGLALQATLEAGEEVNASKALDAAIELFSGKTIDELSSAEGREEAKAELVAEVTELYEDEVYDVYFTTFVMQ